MPSVGLGYAPMATTPGIVDAGEVQPDGDDAYPLTVDSVGGGDGVAVTVSVCRWT